MAALSDYATVISNVPDCEDVDATLDADDILRCAISFAGGEDRLLKTRFPVWQLGQDARYPITK